MSKQNLKIWDRDFELDIVFDVFEGEEILENQKNALELFLDKKEIIEVSKQLVEKYCLETAKNQEMDIDDPITNIFKYVIPKYLYISRTEDETRIVSLMCNFKFDMEHGLAIIFKNEEFEKIGEQGLVL